MVRPAAPPKTPAGLRSALVEAPQEPAKPRPSRAVPPLSDGPLRVPNSTIDWLVGRESPAARYVALRDLLSRSPKDIELRKARLALRTERLVQENLAQLRRRIEREQTHAVHPYEGGSWQTLFLVELGCDRSLPEIQHAADVLFARHERAFVDVEREESPKVDLHRFSIACRTLALLGYADDPRIAAGAEHVARLRLAETSLDAAVPQRVRLTRDLLLFGAIAERRRSGLVKRATDFLVERALATEMPAAGTRSRADEPFGFPAGEEPDLLELLEALARVGLPRRPELDGALALAAAKADHRARWNLERALPAPPLIPEREGELSRWVTIRGLRVMQHFLGLAGESPR